MYSKKIVLLIILSTISFFTNAQKIEKGTCFIGGNLTYLNTSQTNFNGGGYGGGYSVSTTYKTSIFIGALSFSKMATKYFAIGGKISYLGSSNSTTNSAVIGPTARLYINNEKPSTFFILGDLGLNTNGASASYDFGIGLSNLVSEHISIDIIGTYGNSFTSNGTQSSNNNSNIDISVFALQVGLQILLPKKNRSR
jgi:hypothetical protein